ncbi:hypothetical protein, partial [Pseudomonas poae]|uniref:hypothetical protein n=1 Tax=Pseudomonas poae TaxID=200451 RepID=UPI0034D69465
AFPQGSLFYFKMFLKMQIIIAADVGAVMVCHQVTFDLSQNERPSREPVVKKPRSCFANTGPRLLF